MEQPFVIPQFVGEGFENHQRNYEIKQTPRRAVEASARYLFSFPIVPSKTAHGI